MSSPKPDKNLFLIAASMVEHQVLKSFLEYGQHGCVLLCERIQSARQTNWQNEKGTYVCIIDSSSSSLHGIVFASNTGLVLHCLSKKLCTQLKDEAICLLADFMKNRSLYCISGTSDGTSIIRQAVKTSGSFPLPVTCREYILMKFDKTSPEQKANAIPVVSCNESHLEELYPLQSQYDQVEVIPPNQQFCQQLCKKNLLRTLIQNRVYAIQGKNCFEAKASINALTDKYCQIGGVFTKTDCRGKGHAARLVRFIALNATQQGKETVLFVRVQNNPAIQAYKNAGFKPIGTYEIDYY